MGNYEYFYPGSVSSLDPATGALYTGARVSAGLIGASASAQTANQLREVTNLLNQGLKNIEIGTLKAEDFDMIPKEHLSEIRRLSDMTNSEISLHAPMLDPAGFIGQGGWEETNRMNVERELSEITAKAHEMDPDGNIPVTLHASVVPGTEWMPIKDKETGKLREVTQRMVAVNRDTGEYVPLNREERFYPEDIAKTAGGGYTAKLYTPEKELDILNKSHWDQQLSQIVYYKERADELATKFWPLIAGHQQVELTSPEQKAARESVQNALVYFENTQLSLNALFNKAFKFADEGTREVLADAAKDYSEAFKKVNEGSGPFQKINPSAYSGALQILIGKMQEILTPGSRYHIPELFTPIESFVKDKASDTIANVAYKTYDKFGSNSPIMSIENPPYGQAVSTARDLKDLINISREKFVEKAVKEGMSKGDAEKAAEKVIGATWDTSHIAMMRKQGFDNKRLAEEAKIIAPYVKHVHLNDNMGSNHTDLPPGMGNTPMKDVIAALDKENKAARKIFEGGNFFNQFRMSPHPYVLEGLGSPLYPMAQAPYWNQASHTYGNYFSFPSAYLPEQHMSIYGSGFSTLPQELGGQVGGKQSRVTGTPMD